VAVLRHHTTTSADCVYGFWHGYGGFPERLGAAPELVLPGRTYYLFTGGAASTTRPASKTGSRTAAVGARTVVA